MGYHAKVLEDGQIVLPADLAREIGFRDGDTWTVERDGSGFVIRIEAAALGAQERIARALQGYGVDDFLAERGDDWRE